MQYLNINESSHCHGVNRKRVADYALWRFSNVIHNMAIYYFPLLVYINVYCTENNAIPTEIINIKVRQYKFVSVLYQVPRQEDAYIV